LFLRFLYGVLGLAIGAASLFAGLYLLLRGVAFATGKGAVRLGPVRLDFRDVTPGVLFAVLGVTVIYLTRL
jgi:hypothetical protein